LVTQDGFDIAPGARALAQLMLDRPLHALRGDRLVLRDQSARRTIGGGVVIDPLPDMRTRSREERRAYLAAMALPDAQQALPAALKALPGGLDLEVFTRNWNLDEQQCAALRHEPAALADEHQIHPERLGIGERELEKALRARLLRGVFSAVLDDLVNAGQVVRDGAVLRLPQHSARRSAADDALWKRVQPLLERDTLKAPVVHDLATALNLNHTLLEAFLIRIAKQGVVVKVSAKRYFLPSAMARFEQTVRDLTVAGTRFTAADFRDRAGVGRNAAIEILEYFDRIGLTHRSGDLRTLLDTKRRS
jgi:selenocysteine-specific elongation factor